MWTFPFILLYFNKKIYAPSIIISDKKNDKMDGPINLESKDNHNLIKNNSHIE
jgi:hypothetical protein